MTNKLQTIQDFELGFVELNPTQSSTILFIHGALTSPKDFSLVTPFLEDYHILIPALHINTKADNPRPTFSSTSICSQMARLIELKARNGVAHVYGHSMGGSLAIGLAMRHPKQVLSLIASGVLVSSDWPWWKRSLLPHALYAQTLLPRAVLSKQQQVQIFNYFLRPASETFVAEWINQPNDADWALCKEIARDPDLGFTRGKPINVQAKALIVAGTATAGDSVYSVRWIVDEIKKTGGTARGVEIRHGGHPWVMQLPELCADIIKAWISGQDLPEGASSLE